MTHSLSSLDQNSLDKGIVYELFLKHHTVIKEMCFVFICVIYKFLKLKLIKNAEIFLLVTIKNIRKLLI